MSRLSKEKENKIIELYKSGLSAKKISLNLNCDVKTVYRIRDNLQLGYNRQYNFNKQYFYNIDTEEKAYWLGFIYADGCISQSSKHNQNRLIISLSAIDVNHLYKFKKSIEFTGNIAIYKNMCPKAGLKNYCRIHINNKEFIEGLIMHECIPRKSLVLKFPEINPLIIKHFIRGYFDGDGCITLGKDRLAQISLLGTHEFINSCVQIIYENLNIKLNVNKNRSVFKFQTSSLYNVKTILNWIYKDSTIYLDRKFKLYQYILDPKKGRELLEP